MPETAARVLNVIPVPNRRVLLAHAGYQTSLCLAKTCRALRQLCTDNVLWRFWYNEAFCVDHVGQEMEFVLWCALGTLADAGGAAGGGQNGIAADAVSHPLERMDWRSVFRRRYQTAHNWIQDCSRPRRFSLAADLSPQIWRQCYHAATGSVLMGVDVDNSRMSCFVRTDYTRRPQVGGAVTESQVHHLAATNAAVSEKQQLMQMSPRMTVMRVTATGATERMRVWYAGCATPREVVLPREKVEITQLAGRWAVLCSGRRAGDLRWLSVWDLVRGDMLMEWHARAPTVAHIMHADEDTAEVYEYQPSSTGPCTVAWKQWTLSTLDAVADSVCMGACTVLPPMTHSSLLNFSARRVGRAHSALLMRITHTNTVLVVHAHEENTMRGIPLETGERWSEITVCCRGFTLFSSKQYLFFAPDGTLRYRHTTRYNIHSLEPVLGNLYVAVIHDNIGTRHNHLLNISNGEVIRIIPDCYSLALPHISPVALFRIVQVQGELRMRDYGAD